MDEEPEWHCGKPGTESQEGGDLGGKPQEEKC